MMSAMALLTATATAVSASSYGVIIEHIWEDNNNASNTRPTEIQETIKIEDGVTGEDLTEDRMSGIETSGTGGNTITTDGEKAGEGKWQSSSDIPEIKDIEAEGYEAGKKAGAEAREDVDKSLGDTSETLEQPVKPEDLKKPEDLVDYTDEDGSEWKYSAEDKAAYEASYNEYCQKYEAYQAGNMTAEQYEEALKEYYKAANKIFPAGVDESFKNGVNQNLEQNGSDLTADKINSAYDEAFNKGFDESYSKQDGAALAAAVCDDLSESISSDLDALVSGDSEEAAGQVMETLSTMIAEQADTEDVADVNKWVNELSPGNNGPEELYNNSHGLKTTSAMTQESVQALEKAGYVTTLEIQITVVDIGGAYCARPDGNNARIYLSIDGGKTWKPANEEAKKWANGKDSFTSDEVVDYNQECISQTRYTYVHYNDKANARPEKPEMTPSDLTAPNAPNPVKSEGNTDPTPTPTPTPDPDPDPTPTPTPRPTPTPEENIPEEEVPLTELPEPETEIPEEEVPLSELPEPEVEIPEEDVPLSDIPKTGDSSALWMGAALLSGAALLVLTRKREDAEPEEA